MPLESSSMPFTPFHFGPGLLVKGAAPRQVSWTAFAAANVLIDCETLFYILRNEYPLHRHLHTFVGAAAAGAAAAGLLLALTRFVPERLRGRFESELAPEAVIAGAMAGAMTHPFLDGLMHRDIRPFLPFTADNPLLGAVGQMNLHAGCVLAGLAGAVLVWFRTRA